MIPDGVSVSDRFPMSQGSYGGGCVESGSGCIELRSGSVTLVNGGGRRLRVLLKVYRTSLEHFAVLYPDKLVTCCKPMGFVNLKNCAVGGWRRTIQITQRGCDGDVLTFECADAKDNKMWLDVMENASTNSNSKNYLESVQLSSPNHPNHKQRRMNICTNLNLPIVQEEDIDEE